jgi:ethanolamine transporter
MITPVVIGKLAAGILAVALAIIMTKDVTVEDKRKDRNYSEGKVKAEA